MLINEENIQKQVLSAMQDGNRLIEDVATEFGLTNKMVYLYLKKGQKLDRRSSLQKEKALRAKVAKLNDELSQLSY